MVFARLLQLSLLRLLPMLALAGAAIPTSAADAPARIARLNHIEGSVAVAPAGDNEWTNALPNRPLARGDRLWTDRGSRAELQVRSNALRMDGQTQLSFTALNARALQVSVIQGAVQARLRDLVEGENFELDTPNLAFRAAQPGDYRIDVDPAGGSTRVTVLSGSGTAYGEGGQAVTLRTGQQIGFRGRNLIQVAAPPVASIDGFGRWAAERDARLQDPPVAVRKQVQQAQVQRERTGWEAEQARLEAQRLRREAQALAQAQRQTQQARREQLAQRDEREQEQQALAEQWRREHRVYQERAQQPQQGVPILRQH